MNTTSNIHTVISPIEEWLQNIVFINLEERTDRLQHIKKELQKITTFNSTSTITRLNATKTTNGALGCSMSHIRGLEMAKKNEWKYVMICEDDMEIMDIAVFYANLKNMEKRKIKWDVLLLAGNNHQPYQKIANETILKVHNCQTTTAYIVAAHYYDVLIQNFRESSVQLMKEPDHEFLYALDVYWKKLQIRDTWLLSIPLTVSQYSNYSDIEGRDVSYHNLMLDYEKNHMNKIQLPPTIFTMQTKKKNNNKKLL